ncbi:MAG: zf-HC2 domain-containing protein [Lapillicoccus sp.]
MSRHLGMQVSAYVDHRLDAREQHAFDQHLAVCLVCRHAANEERRLLTSLRSGSTPGFSADLTSMLLAMAQPAPAATATGWLRGRSRPGGIPQIPRAPESVRQLRVPTVAPAAPALHRSPRRAAAIAALAAGASAAAAIGLAVVGPGPGASASLRSPAPRVPGTSAVTAVPASFTGSFTGSGLSSSPLRQALQRPGR